MSFKPRIVRPDGPERSPGFILVAVPGTEMSVEITEAQRVRLREWVPHFVDGHLEYFPPAGTVLGRPLPPPPFPVCWEEHPPLVQRLLLAMLRSEEVAHGDAGGYRPEDWYAFLEERVVPLVIRVGRICRNGHVDLSARSPEREFVVAAPRLPGAAMVRPKAGPALATGWRERLSSPPRVAVPSGAVVEL